MDGFVLIEGSNNSLDRIQQLVSAGIRIGFAQGGPTVIDSPAIADGQIRTQNNRLGRVRRRAVPAAAPRRRLPAAASAGRARAGRDRPVSRTQRPADERERDAVADWGADSRAEDHRLQHRHDKHEEQGRGLAPHVRELLEQDGEKPGHRFCRRAVVGWRCLLMVPVIV